MSQLCTSCNQTCTSALQPSPCCGVLLCSACTIADCPRCCRSPCSPGKKDTSDFAGLRVLQRCLVYIVGLSPSISHEELLQKPQFLGQYGTIKKCVVKNSGYKNGTGFSFGVYVTYEREEEASGCIAVRSRQAVDGFLYEGRVLKASLGTTKYCSFFLRGAKCHKADCLFLHQFASEQDTFKRVRFRQEKISISIQPNADAFEFERLQPDGIVSVFPPIQKVPRRRSEDANETSRSPILPPRHMSIDAEPTRPVRKNSRYDFATEGEGEATLPLGFPELLTYASPTDLEAPVPKSEP